MGRALGRTTKKMKAAVGALPTAGSGDEQSSESESDSEGAVSDSAIQDVFDDLEKLRERWHAEHDRYASDDFGGSILGTKWTFKKTGHPADNVLFQANSEDAVQWCDLYGLPRSKRATILVYDISDATVICREWAKKMQWYFDIYNLMGDGYEYQPHDHTNYVPLPEFVALSEKACKPKGMAEAIRSVEKLRATRPKR